MVKLSLVVIQRMMGKRTRMQEKDLSYQNYRSNMNKILKMKEVEDRVGQATIEVYNLKE